MESRIQGWMKNIKYVELSFKSIDFCDLITNIGYSDFVRIINVLMAKLILIFVIHFYRQFQEESCIHALKGKDKKIYQRINTLQYFLVGEH